MESEWLVEAYESISWIKHANWLSMSQFKKGGVTEEWLYVTQYYMVIHLGCAHYINDLGCYLT